MSKIDLAVPSLRMIGSRPFNGQLVRIAIFRAIIDACDISTIVETGTHRGTTTEYMARNFSGPIYTFELNPRYFKFAKQRLVKWKNVTLSLGDSRLRLSELLEQWAGNAAFVYLDAHWNNDLPLLEEISLILKSQIPAVIMIDDFEVPYDQGYGYDIYGRDKKLSLQMLRKVCNRRHAFFPASAARQESGARRGCVVLATSAELEKQLQAVKDLRQSACRCI